MFPTHRIRRQHTISRPAFNCFLGSSEFYVIITTLRCGSRDSVDVEFGGERFVPDDLYRRKKVLKPKISLPFCIEIK
ncbi:hypothetical protein NECAME_04272 [Necator americanus]|uniref:Uncharacterized protein n=1 Tax=Necator americanus TaxID=51031 RepID=W2SXI2_NECAM|nr:hypothetical protein NECAME_04272 [Necator americanus]ETN73586.1 hypothetical protein NECAME_04272 [Necator americanus]